ncbi:hypothetical protein DEO72_LG3g2323 [Vigna unguiculata]|uniref:Uncharacterized protein n=1 Tax=Vigna unguiculata TaxID=3917 RepID=A0A4D6LGY9_VIGUN|nr:hypothetical protein DEO72_LG3g2323 [Vigna unguiculata]
MFAPSRATFTHLFFLEISFWDFGFIRLQNIFTHMLYVFDHDPNGHIGFYWGVANDGSVVVLNHLHHFQLGVCFIVNMV